MSSLPKTYKAAVCEEAGKPLKIKEIELKEPEEGQILVKVLANGICHSDAMVIQGQMGKLPIIPGHEIVGDVVKMGPNTEKTGFKEGDRVGSGWHGGHDGTCVPCQRAFFQGCDNATINGILRDGGYAEYVLLRAEAVCHIPKEMDPAEAAPFMCAGATVFNGIRQMNIRAGGTVAIQGSGGLGHLAIQFSRKMGYHTVCLSRGEDKKKFATDLGAHVYVDTAATKASEELQKIGGADLIVVTAPNPDVVPDLINGLAKEGTLLLLAPVGPVQIDSIAMITKALKVRGWASGHSLDNAEAVEFAQRNGVKCMIEKFPLDKAEEAYQYMMAGKPRFRAVLTM